VVCCFRTRFREPGTLPGIEELVALNSSEVLPVHDVLDRSGVDAEPAGSTKR
jgi:hypothetical protein